MVIAGIPQPLVELVDLTQATERAGILISKEIAGETMWDDLAKVAPMHAAISAKDEAHERAKSAEHIEQIERVVTDSTVLLDLGCGYGRLAKYLLPRKQLGGYVGVDRAYTMLQLFKDRYYASEEERRTPALFLNSDISKMPLKSGSIDLVFMAAVFLHNHKSVVRAAMQEVERVLKPGAMLIVLSSFPRRATAMGLQGAIHQAFLNATRQPMRNGPVRYYSKGEVTQLFRNFSRITITPHGFAVLPKSIIGLRGWPERFFRTALSNPVNSMLERILPRRTHSAFARFYDVIAQK